ncbi:MAG: flagellar biosynthesis anti-sigma factor FlgM [Planctomycetota bacterium]|jgi:hypothetical protein
MVNFDCNSDFLERAGLMDSPSEDSPAQNDLLMERILENIHNTPMGQVLKRIASLPEVRKEKVLDVRRQLTDGEYDLSARLDIALEKVLEDLE